MRRLLLPLLFVVLNPLLSVAAEGDAPPPQRPLAADAEHEDLHDRRAEPAAPPSRRPLAADAGHAAWHDRQERAEADFTAALQAVLSGKLEDADARLRDNVRASLPYPSPLRRVADDATRNTNEPAIQKGTANLLERLKEIEKEIEAETGERIRRFPRDARALGEMAGHHLRRGDHQGSLRWADRALQQSPDNGDLHYIRSRDLLELGEHKEAVKAATKAIAKDRRNADAWSVRAKAAFQLGDFKLAYTDAREAVALNPDDHMADTIAGVAAKKLGPDELAELRGRAAAGRKDADAPPPARDGGQPLTSSAIDDPNALEVRGQPAGYRAQTLYKQSLNQLDLGDYSAAAQSAEAAIKLSPASPEPYAASAAANNYLGRTDQAVAAASRALELAPDNRVALNARAWAFNQQNKPERALADAERAVAMAPRDAFALMNRAMAYEKLENWEKAAQDYEAAVALDPGLTQVVQAASARYEKASGKVLRFPGSTGASTRRGAPRRGWTFSALALVGGIGGGFLLAFLFATSREKPVVAAGPAETRAADAMVGGCYKLVREIGRGGMGVVYEAEDQSLNRTVALKKMKEELRLRPRDKDRFLQEARTVAGLRHPNIVEIYSVFEDGGDLFLVFEHVSGMTLDEHLYRRGKLSAVEAREMLAPVCSALAYAHGQKVIHRDLKPSNIMVTAEGAVKVMDFGLARQAKDTLSALTQTDAAGTPAYMAPEMGRGQPRRESDIFMLGAVLYEMLTGKMPFEGANLENQKLRRAYAPPSELVPELPMAIDSVVAKALSPEPDDRYHTPQELLAAYDAALKVFS